MSKNIKNLAIVSISTIGSRVFGLLRDILIFATLGVSVWNSAFIMAFTLPNLFRRLLGEGALSSAFVPIFSDLLERSGREKAFAFFNTVLKRLACGLLILILFGVVLIWIGLQTSWLPQHWRLSGQLAVLLLPYMLFICLAAVVAAGLNVLGRFATPASTPVVLNLCMIGALLLGQFWSSSPQALVYWLCAGVLVGGFLQLLIPTVDLCAQGWRPAGGASDRAELAQLWALFLPGLAGAAVLQVNILISRVLANSVNEWAVSVLYLASRLMELPLGVFTIAVTTVFFPLLAKSVTNEDVGGFREAFNSGMRLVLAISVPAGIGLCLLGKPIIQVLFEWGAFDRVAVEKTIPVLAIYGVGLPFYSVATFATRALHAMKEMKLPVRVAAICLCVNLVAGLVLMQLWAEIGLALANVLAASVQAGLLLLAVCRARPEVGVHHLTGAVNKIVCAGALMGGFCVIGEYGVSVFDLTVRLESLFVVVGVIPVAAIMYFCALWLLGLDELSAVVARFKNRS